MVNITKEVMGLVSKRKFKDFNLNTAIELDRDIGVYVANGGKLTEIEDQLWIKLANRIIDAQDYLPGYRSRP